MCNGYRKKIPRYVFFSEKKYFFSKVCSNPIFVRFISLKTRIREKKLLLLGFQHHDQKESNYGCPSKEQKIGTIDTIY